jgi:DNA-binding SARP family transcriptional activator
MTLGIGDIAPDFAAETTADAQASVPGNFRGGRSPAFLRVAPGTAGTPTMGLSAATHSITGCRSGETREIRLIGNLAVLRNGDALALPNSRKTRALLAYLILNPGPHRRERLCEIFWHVPDDPRGSLRWSLCKLRSLVNGAGVTRIIADRETVAFDPAGTAIDIFQLREALANGCASLDTGKLADLASIASCGLLPGLDPSGQPDFVRFLTSQRETFRAMRRELLCELIRRRLRQSPGDAASWLQELVEIEPYSVEAHATLIATLIRAGRKADAEWQLQSSLSILSEIEGIDLAALRRAAACKPLASGVPLFIAPVAESGLAHGAAVRAEAANGVSPKSMAPRRLSVFRH